MNHYELVTFSTRSIADRSRYPLHLVTQDDHKSAPYFPTRFITFTESMLWLVVPMTAQPKRELYWNNGGQIELRHAICHAIYGRIHWQNQDFEFSHGGRIRWASFAAAVDVFNSSRIDPRFIGEEAEGERRRRRKLRRSKKNKKERSRRKEEVGGEGGGGGGGGGKVDKRPKWLYEFVSTVGSFQGFTKAEA